MNREQGLSEPAIYTFFPGLNRGLLYKTTQYGRMCHILGVSHAMYEFSRVVHRPSREHRARVRGRRGLDAGGRERARMAWAGRDVRRRRECATPRGETEARER